MDEAVSIESERAGGAIGRAMSAFGCNRDRRCEANRVAAERMAQHTAAQEAAVAEERKRADFEREAIPHLDALYNFAVRMTGSTDGADDLVQETFLKAYRFFDKFERGTNCKAWLFRIMKNSYINRYRKAQKSPEVVDYDTVEDFYYSIRSQGADGNDLQQLLFERILDDEVTAAIEKLPTDFRTIVILCDLEGFTYEEAAEFVDCPVGTVRSRLHRGRKLLRDSLLEYANRRGYPLPASEEDLAVDIAA